MCKFRLLSILCTVGAVFQAKAQVTTLPNGNVGVGTTTPQAAFQIGLKQNVVTAPVYNLNATNLTDANYQGLLFNSYNTTADGYKRFGDITALGYQNGSNGGGTLRFLTNDLSQNTAQERMRIERNGFIGIGTAAPSHQLHTTGSVRFQTLTGTNNRLLQTDATGVLAPVASGAAGQVLTQTAAGLAWTTPTTAPAAWNLTGNTANTPASFLGTIDNQSVIVKTGGVERFRVRPQSNSTVLMSNLPIPVGTWDTDPNANVIGVSMEIQRTPITYGASIGLSSSISAVNGASVSGSATAHLAATESWYAAGHVTGVASGVNISKIAQSSKVYTSGAGVFGLNLENASLTSPAENFVGGVVSTLSGSIANSQNMVIASVLAEDKINSKLTWAAYMRGKAYISGNLAVGTTAPTAQLHTVGTVRHQNLPSGAGKALVIDANGNVFVSNTLAGLAPSDNNGATELLEAQKQEINELKSRLERLEKLLSNTMIVPKDDIQNIVLEQNRPNPANASTSIGYELPNNYIQIQLNISDATGKIIHTQPLSEPKGTVEINTNNWNDGVYVYTLVADGKVLKTKKMIVGKN